MHPPKPETVSALRTRATLLKRVRKWDDRASWAEFHELYRRLVYGLARRSGLAHADAEDVAQDVFKRVAETIHKFESDPERGTFRGWLMNLTRWRIANKYAKMPKLERGAARRHDDTGGPRTSTIERVPDGGNPDAEWEKEWRRHLLAAACERLARRVSARHYQVFDLYLRQRRPVPEVVRETGMTASSIYVICHRLTQQLRTEVEKLQLELG